MAPTKRQITCSHMSVLLRQDKSQNQSYGFFSYVCLKKKEISESKQSEEIWLKMMDKDASRDEAVVN